MHVLLNTHAFTHNAHTQEKNKMLTHTHTHTKLKIKVILLSEKGRPGKEAHALWFPFHKSLEKMEIVIER